MFSRFLALPIQTSLFSLYGAATCVGPYVGNYLKRYTIADERDLGTIESISAVTNIFLRLTLGYVADRYRLHRLVYLLCSLVYLVASTSLIGPIFLSNNPGVSNNKHSETTTTTTPTLASSNSTQSADDFNSSRTTPEPHELATSEPVALEALQWFYMIAGLVVIMGLATRANMNLADAFCANIALKTNSSYSAIRFWGGVGRSVCAITLIFVNQLEPFLFPALMISTALTTLNVLVIALWPSNEPFDMSDEVYFNENNEFDGANLMRIKFSYKKRSHLLKRKLDACFSDLQVLELNSLPSKSQFNSPIRIINIRLANQFDDASKEPLDGEAAENRIYIEQVEVIDNVTRIELVSRKRPAAIQPQPEAVEWPEPPPALLPDHLSPKGADTNAVVAADGSEVPDNNDEPDNFGLTLYLKIILMIAMKDKQLVRFILLYIVNGIVAAPNWVFLFRYLESIDAIKFARLSVYVLVSRYLSETIFYYLSPRSMFESISHSTSLSIILFIYGLRYSSYPLLGGSLLPLESIVLIETLRAFNMGWYNCVSNEAALKFALQSNKCLPELIASGRVENNERTIERLNTGFKATMVVISACCFDGLGFAIGSYAAGVITQSYDFRVLWLATGGFAVAASLLNLLLEPLTTSFRSGQRRKSNGDSVVALS